MNKPYFCPNFFLIDWRHKRLKNTIYLLLFYEEPLCGFSESDMRNQFKRKIVLNWHKFRTWDPGPDTPGLWDPGHVALTPGTLEPGPSLQGPWDSGLAILRPWTLGPGNLGPEDPDHETGTLNNKSNSIGMCYKLTIIC